MPGVFAFLKHDGKIATVTGMRMKVAGKILIVVLMIVNFPVVIVIAFGKIVFSILEIVIFAGKR